MMAETETMPSPTTLTGPSGKSHPSVLSHAAAGTSKALPPANGWTRRDRPCDACRRRKSRCILLEGAESCVLCHSRAEECTFVQIPQRRKRRRDEESSEGASNPRSPEAKQNANAKQVILDYSSLQGPTLLKKTLGLQNRQHGHYLGETTEYDPRLSKRAQHSAGRGVGGSTDGLIRPVSPRSHFVLFKDTAAAVDAEVTDLDAIDAIVAPHGRALVDLYFRIVHPSFPIMHKKVFLEKYARTYREFTPAVLAAVYILALNWWSYSPELVSLPKPDVHALERLVAKSMGDVLDRPKFSNVQAGLLLLQRPDGDSWALTGQLIAVGQNLGLHLDCSAWNIPAWERGLRKRLAWGLFMQDKWGALIHGRPSHITRDNWIVKPVETGNFPETAKDDDDEEGSSDVEKGRLSFVHMISLTEILSDILDQFFTLRQALEGGGGDVVNQVERARPLQVRLKEWYTKLPACLALGDTKARKLSSTGYLHLAYHTASITLDRALLRSLIPTTPPSLRHTIRATALIHLTSATDLVSRLSPAHLQSFWYFASKVNLAIIGTFGSVLWATSLPTSSSSSSLSSYQNTTLQAISDSANANATRGSSPDPADDPEAIKAILAEYRWTLRVSSKGAEFMRLAVEVLDASPVFTTTSASTTAASNIHYPSNTITSRSGSARASATPRQMSTANQETVGNENENDNEHDNDDGEGETEQDHDRDMDMDMDADVDLHSNGQYNHSIQSTHHHSAHPTPPALALKYEAAYDTAVAGGGPAGMGIHAASNLQQNSSSSSVVGGQGMTDGTEMFQFAGAAGGWGGYGNAGGLIGGGEWGLVGVGDGGVGGGYGGGDGVAEGYYGEFEEGFEGF